MAELASNESSKEMLDLKVKLREDTKTSAWLLATWLGLPTCFTTTLSVCGFDNFIF